MVDKFEAESDRFTVIRADKVAFDTRAPSFMIFPGARLQFTVDVVFPDMLSALFYESSVVGSNAYCESWSGLLPQEWGPDEPYFNPDIESNASVLRNLVRISLGRSVPAGTNHLNIQARLRRTKTPPAFFNDIPPSLYFPHNQWINLVGGSCSCEGIGTFMKRHFDVVLVGTELFLDRYQSMVNFGGPFTTSASAGQRGWITNLPNEGAAMGAYNSAPFGRGYPMVKIDQKGPDGNGTKFRSGAPNSSNPCADNANLDYESIYSVDFDIQPGRYLA